MIAIIDYGVGNLFSLASSFRMIGAEVTVTDNADEIRASDKIILPGVGAFGDAAQKLRVSGMAQILAEQAKKGKEIMGICLGMQLLFEKSFEYGEHAGLGLLKGQIVPMEGNIPPTLKIPHIGWNALHFRKKSKLQRYIKENDCVYFVHSYYAEHCEDSLAATAKYGKELTAMVQNGNIMGCQFHPEKSGSVGLNILKAFCEDGL